MTISLEADALNNLRMAASQGQHERVITDSKVIRQQLEHLHLETLDIQARSYVARGQFTTALDIATTMKEMYPTLALGYLCQGYILMQQGRYLAATRVYDKAMAHVPMTDAEYERMKQEKTMATKKMANRIDPIAYLPNDISFRIFQLLFTGCFYEEYRQYLLVSCTWLDCILAYGQLDFDIHYDIPTNETNPVIIKSFQRVRSIQLISCSHPFYSWFKAPNRFESLSSLSIDQSSFGKTDEAIPALRSIGKTLTTLILRDNSRLQPPLYLKDILSSCPHLVTLHCITDIKLSSLDNTYPALLDLMLHPIIQIGDSDMIMDILPCFPSLRMLDLCNVPTSAPMNVIHTSCRALEYLKISDGKDAYAPKELSLSRSPGLRSLEIKNRLRPYSSEDILSLLIAHHATLETLIVHHDLGTSDDKSIHDTMNKNKDVVFKKLNDIHVNCMSDTANTEPFLDVVAWTIQRSFKLRTIHLGGYTVYKPIMNAMVQCIHLESMRLDDFSTFIAENRPKDYDKIVAQFLKEHVDYMGTRNGSRLQMLHISMMNVDPSLHYSMGALTYLNDFMLNALDLTDPSFVDLFESLRLGCNQLSTVTICSGIFREGDVHNDILYQLRDFPNLENLSIHANLSECIMGTLSLRRCSTLRRLICLSSYLDKEVFHALKDRIASVYP
ncbi:hypothetical protein K492DRAFT_210899 [Lichtheimia hyalospora FSU 10163]|nr:hypothetical protein K492DRAFT_210899 [Lichtheimia hyalospora FSU 10163]